MSIFFAQGNVSDSEQSSNEEIIKNQKIKPTYDFGDDDDNGPTTKKPVLTEKQKKWNQIKNLSNKIQTFLNNKDFQKAWNNLQELIKQVEKASKVIEKQGKYPAIFLKTLHRLEEDVLGLSNSDKKKLNKGAATAFNIMKQKLKNKILPQYDAEIKKFLEDQQAYESAEQEEPFSSEQSSSEESESDDEERGDWRSDDIMVRRRYFLKKEVKTGRKPSEAPSEGEKPKQTHPHAQGQDTKGGQGTHVAKQKFHIKQKKKKTEIKSVQQAQARIRNIISTFHKLTTKDERQEYLQELNMISQKSKQYKDFEKISFLLVDIPIRIEVYRQMKLTHFYRDNWRVIYRHVSTIYELMRESQEDQLIDNVQLFAQGSEEKVTEQKQQQIYKAIQAFLIILENQLRKAFLFVDKSDVEYSERLQDLIRLTDFMYKVSRDMSFHDQMAKETNELAFKVLQNMYFMSAKFLQKLNSDSQTQLRFTQLSVQATLQQYSLPILRHDIYTTKTILYLVFNHAINQREKAKQMLMMSNIPDIINDCDYYTQAIYNRCIVQIGILSFHNGKYFEVQQFLSQICGYGKNRDQTRQIIKEFLAQGGSRATQIPRSKILPYYLHLNIQLIESLQLIASMILEIPYTLTQGGRITAKTFKKVYFEYERSHFIAEPLNHRDLIYAASSQLKRGNWKQCYNRLLQLQIWSEIENVETTQRNMLQIIKEYSLKCYLLANKKCFRSISVENLTKKFEIQQKVIRKLISKWIYSRDLQGSINERGYLVLTQKKQSDMQKLCQNMFNKLEDIRKSYEQVLEQRFNQPAEGDDEEAEKEREMKLNRRFNLAMNEKLKAILSRRN